jgi:hypothetical protein
MTPAAFQPDYDGDDRPFCPMPGGQDDELHSVPRRRAVRGANDGTPAAITATPFRWRDRSTIPTRPWVYGRWLLRGTVTAVVAPGGVGKSSFMAGTVLALSTGRPLLGKPVWGGAQRAWYWNLEDDAEELERQVQAAALHHRVTPEACGDRLYIDSGMEIGHELCIAMNGPDGFTIVRPVIAGLEAELRARAIDVLIVDPFVSSHSVEENDNNAIDAIVKEWARLAKRVGCAIVLVHHSKKLGSLKVTAEASRGASSLVNAARATLVLNRMDEQEAKQFMIEGDDERRRLFTVQDDKHNRAPAENAEWYRMASIDLGNFDGEHSDNVGVVTRWTPPDAFEGVTVDHLRQVQAIIADGEFRESSQAGNWVGTAVASVLGISADKSAKADRQRISNILHQWLGNGALRIDRRMDPAKGREVPFVVVGQVAA